MKAGMVTRLCVMLTYESQRLGVGLAWLLVAFSAVAATETVTLTDAGEQTFPLQRGDTLDVRLAVDTDRPWLLAIVRHGISLEVEILSREQPPFKHPVTRYSGEYVYVARGDATSTHLRLITEDGPSPPGRVTLTLADASELPAVLSSVDGWAADGARAFAERSREGRVAASAAYARIARVLRATRQPLLQRVRADAIHAQGEIAYFLEDAVATTAYLREAADLYARLNLPAEAATALSSLGLWYVDKRQADAASTAFDEAADAAELAQDPIIMAAVQYNRCLVPLTNQRLAEADQCLALAATAAARADDSRIMRSTRNAQAGIYSMRGEAAKALPMLLEQLASVDDTRWYQRGTLQNNIALQYRRLGNTPKALKHYQLALAANRAADLASNAVRNLMNIANAYDMLGDDERAERHIQEALALAEDINNGSQIAFANLRLARLDRQRGALDEATTHLDKANQFAGDDAVFRSDLAEEQATIALIAGKPEAALNALDEAAGWLDGLDVDYYQQANRALIRADAETLLGEQEAAAASISSAIADYTAAGYPLGLALAHAKRAQQRLDAGELAGAEREAQEALRYYGGIRGHFASLDLRANHAAQEFDVHDTLIEIAMRRHAKDSAAGHDALALSRVANARAQTLAETMYRDATTADPATRQLLNKRVDLLTRLSRHADSARAQQNQAPLSELLLELDTLDQKLADIAPRRAAISGDTAIDLEQIKAQLGDASALLTVHLGRASGYVWLLDASGLRAATIGDPNEVRAAARQFAKALRERRPIANSRDVLSEKLLVFALDQQIENLLVSVSDELSYVPLEVLTSAPDGTALLDAVNVTYVPTPAALVTAPPRVKEKTELTRITLFADPLFSPDDTRIAETRGLMDDEAWNRLPHTRREAEAIRKLPLTEVSAAIGAEANRDAFLRAATQPTDVLHVATHGIVNSERPELSGLMLSRYQTDGGLLDGFVGTRDIYALDLAARLVVLSACETALGRELRGEGLIGLTRAFLYAGADEVVASLWQVSDRATAELMSTFYAEHIGAHRDAAEALRRAKQRIRANPRWKHPYYWSGIVLHGAS